jgi:hypothetical protein
MARTPTKLRRPGERPAPRQMTDEQLAQAGPDEIEKRISEHVAAASRLEAADDPGAGLPAKDAARARASHVKQIEKHVTESERLKAAADLLSPEAERQKSLAEKFTRWARGKEIEAATTDEDREFARGLHENLRTQEKERKAKAKLKELEEKRRHPADPRSSSITACVLADSELLFDGLKKKLHDTGNGEFTADRLFEHEDIAVAYTLLHLLEERSEIVILNFSSFGSFPGGELPHIDKLPERLRHLRANGIFDLKIEGSTARVRYGPEIRRIAEQWGLSLAVTAELRSKT